MIHLELDEEEIAMMQQIIEDCLSDLRSEIYDTHSLDYKAMLKDRKLLLLKIQGVLEESKMEPEIG